MFLFIEYFCLELQLVQSHLFHTSSCIFETCVAKILAGSKLRKTGIVSTIHVFCSLNQELFCELRHLGFSYNNTVTLIVCLVFRMLDENFKDQMEEIMKLSPRGRQTMLFSATMTDEVSVVKFVNIFLFSLN